MITGIGSAVKKSANEAKKANLDAHFGDISLSLEELNDVAGYLIQSRSLDQVREALSAFDELDGLDEEIEDSVKNLNRMNWKIDIGMELTEEENQAYQDDIQSFITNVQDYATQQQYAVTLSVEALLGDDLEDSNLVDTLNEFYSGKQGELASLGKQLNDTVTEAFNDGFLSIDEAETIMNLQRQMGEIQAELSEGEYKAQLSLLGEEYGGSLNADSFLNLIDEVGTQTEAAMADYESAYIKSMSGVNAAYDSGEMTGQEYAEESERLNSAYLERKAETQAQGMDFLAQTVLQQYSDELSDILPGLEEDLNSIMGDAMESILNGSTPATAWDTAGYAIEDLNNSLSKDTINALKDLWEQMEPQVEQMQQVAAEFTQAGKELPEALSEGLTNAASVGVLAGDVEAAYTVLGENVRDSEEYQQTLEEIQGQGAYIPEGLANAISENTEAITEGVSNLYSFTEGELNRTFGKGFDVNVPVYANPTAYYQSPEKAAEASKKTGGLATGGIITSPRLTWFAEDGPEAAIPLDGSQNAIDLWLRTGELLNMPGLTGEGSTIAEGVETAAYYNESSPVQVTYSPVNNFYGTSQEDVEAALETDQERFARMMDEYTRNRRRTVFQ